MSKEDGFSWDDEYTKQWEVMQSLIAVDDNTVLMPTTVFEGLPEYSCTLPTGVYANKVWKRENYYPTREFPARWYMGRYAPPVDGRCAILWREIILVG